MCAGRRPAPSPAATRTGDPRPGGAAGEPLLPASLRSRHGCWSRTVTSGGYTAPPTEARSARAAIPAQRPDRVEHEPAPGLRPRRAGVTGTVRALRRARDANQRAAARRRAARGAPRATAAAPPGARSPAIGHLALAAHGERRRRVPHRDQVARTRARVRREESSIHTAAARVTSPTSIASSPTAATVQRDPAARARAEPQRRGVQRITSWYFRLVENRLESRVGRDASSSSSGATLTRDAARRPSRFTSSGIT